MSQVFPSKNNETAEIAFLDAIFTDISPRTRVVIVTDAGFQSAWFRHIKSLGWDFIGRFRGVKLRLDSDKDKWLAYLGDRQPGGRYCKSIFRNGWGRR